MARKIISEYSAQWRFDFASYSFAFKYHFAILYLYKTNNTARAGYTRCPILTQDARKRSVLNDRKTLVLCTCNNIIFRKQTFRPVSNLYERVNLRLEKSACERYSGPTDGKGLRTIHVFAMMSSFFFSKNIALSNIPLGGKKNHQFARGYFWAKLNL